MFRPSLYHLQGILHQADIHAHKTQKNYQIGYKFMVLKFVEIVKFAVKVVCRICFGKNVMQCTQILPRILYYAQYERPKNLIYLTFHLCFIHNSLT
jgi:hypothetical protein